MSKWFEIGIEFSVLGFPELDTGILNNSKVRVQPYLGKGAGNGAVSEKTHICVIFMVFGVVEMNIDTSKAC